MFNKLNKRVVKILNNSKSKNNHKKSKSNTNISKNINRHIDGNKNINSSYSKNAKVIKLKSDFESQNFINLKKLRTIFVVIICPNPIFLLSTV